MDYKLGDDLKQACKAVEFVAKHGPNFAFYAIIKVRGQQPPDEVRLYCSPTEGICPPPEKDLRYLYVNGDVPEYKVYVPVDQLRDGWTLMRIDLPENVQKVAALEGKEWELDELLQLRLKGDGVEAYVACIRLYSRGQ